ncbi:MAG: PQQ-binding-like beta-propeller repeat protein, partial [Pirellulaceae bacterium]
MPAGRDFGWRSGSFLLIAILLAGIELQSGPLFAQATAVKKVDPLDWTFWRGPSYNGTSLETGLIDDWDPRGGEGSNVTWKREDLGGRSTPIVMNGKIYLLTRAEPETAREGERVLCLDAVTGKTIWENRFNVFLSDVPDTRVGWSSVCGDPQTGYVYALGVCGYFQCLEGATGKVIWSVSMHERFGLLSTYGGRTNFPVICDDLVIISAIVIGWGDMAKPA